MKRRLRTLLSLGFAVILFVTVAIISLVANLLINAAFRSYIKTQQEDFSAMIAAGVSAQYDDETGWNEDYIHGIGMYALGDGFILKVVDASGEVVWDAENHDTEYCHRIMQEIIDRMQKAGKSGGFTEPVAYSLEKDGVFIGTAYISYYPYYFNENAFGFVDSLNVILLIIGILAVAAAVCAGTVFARKISVPLSKVADIADEIAQGNFSARAEEETGTAELSELSRSINNMAEKIERQETLRKQLTSDVAHELRTPLSNISAQLEVITEGVFEPTRERLEGIFEEVSRLGGLVNDLQRLQQIESDEPVFGSVELLSLALSAASAFEAEVQKNGLVCRVSGEEVVVEADANKLKQVICNLLSNAVKYSLAGGAIEIRVKDGGDCAVLEIEDGGIGISKEELPLIFERFYRTDKSRSRRTGGVGIGLTIADAIVKAHGGVIVAESEEGKGSTFRVILPKKREEGSAIRTKQA